jgi:glycosyltransferase involved in cell wall biosynthesis
LPDGADDVLDHLNCRLIFLMVGTLEPRKGHHQVLEAFEQLWQRGLDVNLVIVGKQGWLVEQLVKKISLHPELGRRLLWLDGISDEYLEKVYAASTCLIAASEGEGFGLPLIEAAQHGLPVIARDLPVFREVAGDHAFYYSGNEPKSLVDALWRWIELYRQGKAPKSDGMPRLTWEQSAGQFLKAVLA